MVASASWFSFRFWTQHVSFASSFRFFNVICPKRHSFCCCCCCCCCCCPSVMISFEFLSLLPPIWFSLSFFLSLSFLLIPFLINIFLLLLFLLLCYCYSGSVVDAVRSSFVSGGGGALCCCFCGLHRIKSWGVDGTFSNHRSVPIHY